jgi:activating signal cointegrator 1
VKALTVRQPFAQAIALGIKRFETRSWDYGHRALLAIHAGKFSGDQACFRRHQEAFGSAGFPEWDDLPKAAVIAVVEVAEVLETVELVFRGEITDKGRTLGVTPLEVALGNWEPGGKAWRLSRVRRLRAPIPARGLRKLFTWQPPAGLSQQLEVAA